MSPLSLPAADRYDLSALIFYVGDTQVIPVNNPQRISVSRPEILDVVSASEKELVLVAKAKGEAKLQWWDAFGEHNFDVKVYAEEMTALKNKIEKVLKELGMDAITVKAMDSEDKVFLFGELKKQEKEKLMAILAAYKAKIGDFIVEADEDVLIEIAVEVLELSHDATRSLGFNFPSNTGIGETLPTDRNSLGHFAEFYKLGQYGRSGDSFSYSLDLLETEGKARILSRPRVTCQSGKTAEITVGGEKPIFNTNITSIGGGAGTTVEYKPYGINLSISPVVDKKGKINVMLKISVTDLEAAESISSGSSTTAKAYPTLNRSVSTQIYMADGETIAIGGLIRKKTEEAIAKFPWLSDTPILGAFFRHKSMPFNNDAEFYITLTPRIVYSAGMEKAGEKQAAPAKEIKKEEKESDAMETMRSIPFELQDYALAIQKKITDNISYPLELVNTGWQGNVLVKLILDDVGQLKDAYVAQTSGYKVFDEAALRLVQKLVYPPFPAQVELKELRIDIPIVYRERK
jgi:pilus assembly protein CpaC